MNLDVDFLIKFYKNGLTKTKSEFKEQTAGAAPSGGSGKTPKKWASGIKDGPARGFASDPKHKWTGAAAGRANPRDYD